MQKHFLLNIIFFLIPVKKCNFCVAELLVTHQNVSEALY